MSRPGPRVRSRVRSRPGAVALVLAAALLASPGCASAPAGDSGSAPGATAGPEQPQVLSDAQAEELAAMRFKNFADGVVAVEGQVLGGGNGDLALAGWLDFAQRTGYARVVSNGAAPILVVWDEHELAYLDEHPAEAASPGALAPPPETPPTGAWQRDALVAETSELTRMLAALLLLSADRPENPLLLRQNGARYLGREDVAGVPADRFSGVSAQGLSAEGAAEGAAAEETAAAEADLASQYWLDADGRLVRFGLRVAGDELSTVDLLREAGAPDELPGVETVGAPDAG
ncbi:hypothetical protein MUN78_01690 [Leucobacter allii]|uniref:Lipoprotein n=1 Tax=Leucobacter allii TaxID=2932247 RepID=A0ABY4FMS1_9MICO|nr:hypothetical protein [Leucobacter allii]UOQ57583.1 hypothetical protein MUN78_01690 [Leucobacter allii]